MTTEIPLDHHTKLLTMHYPQFEDEKMEGTPYASVVGSTMYDMVCCRSDLRKLLLRKLHRKIIWWMSS
ncbi:hypothetical protein MTR_4g031810 [Medicago truncatula]|uniref:Uncharacterized protein n=1 Tax=Medicago truncatula TaxID=3880 RepID=G7JM24_MEDTR|nr:hypothetical protein MTR_4g031810 [Medicago truncatula]